jgi:hypothetical protein
MFSKHCYSKFYTHSYAAVKIFTFTSVMGYKTEIIAVGDPLR